MCMGGKVLNGLIWEDIQDFINGLMWTIKAA